MVRGPGLGGLLPLGGQLRSRALRRPGERLAEEVFKQWLIAGKTGPSGLRRYVNALGYQLPEPHLRNNFMTRAESMLLHLQSGYVS